MNPINPSKRSGGTAGSDTPGGVGTVVAAEVLPTERIELLAGFGRSSSATSYVYRPSTVDGVRRVFDVARQTGRSVGLRGAGRSYGDAALNAENIVLDLTRLNRILDWSPERGIIDVEAGVTIRQLWQHAIGDGWWPPVVPGTMFPTLGGCLAMNIHGKNNFHAGTIGEHVLDFDLLLPSGDVRHCSPTVESELFEAAIGGFGMLGVITRLRLQLKRVHSGLLDVEPINVRSLEEMFDVFERRVPFADYLVGWIDAFASGAERGRGVIHQANYLKEGDDDAPAQTLRIEHQELPDTIGGILPKSVLWKVMRPFANDFGVRRVNQAKYLASRALDRGGHYRQSHAAFAFLLDYVPEWRRAYGPGGLIQYQSFVPRERARDVFSDQLHMAQEAGHPSYLAVFKRHRPDRFLMSHAVDGYSLALDFRITPGNRSEIFDLAHRMNEVVLEAGGRFYFAKDSTLQAPAVRRFLGDDAVDRFLRLKSECDPESMLETNLFRRLFPEAADGAA